MGAKGASASGGTVLGVAFAPPIGRSINGILKFGHFWQIGICIADSDIFTPLISHNSNSNSNSKILLK